MTLVQVSVPEEYVGAVLSDLSSARRAQVKGVTESEDRERVVTATVPLATLLVSNVYISFLCPHSLHRAMPVSFVV